MEELLDLPLLRAFFQPHGSLGRFQQVFRTCNHSLTSGFVCTRRASNLASSMVSAYLLAEPVKRDSNQVDVKLLCLKKKPQRHADSASIGARRRPRLGCDPMSVCPHSCCCAVCAGAATSCCTDCAGAATGCCADCAGSATSCCTLVDAAVTKRLLRAPSLRARCPRSAAPHRRDSQSAATLISGS